MWPTNYLKKIPTFVIKGNEYQNHEMDEIVTIIKEQVKNVRMKTKILLTGQ